MEDASHVDMDAWCITDGGVSAFPVDTQAILQRGSGFLRDCLREGRVLKLAGLPTPWVKGYRMVLASICEHASSAFIFASTSSDQFPHASSEHFRNYKCRSASTL